MGSTTVDYYVKRLRYRINRLKIEYAHLRYAPKRDPRMINEKKHKKMLRTLRAGSADGQEEQLLEEPDVIVDQDEFRGFSSDNSAEDRAFMPEKDGDGSAAAAAAANFRTPTVDGEYLSNQEYFSVSRNIRSAPPESSGSNIAGLIHYGKTIYPRPEFMHSSSEVFMGPQSCNCNCHHQNNDYCSPLLLPTKPGSAAGSSYSSYILPSVVLDKASETSIKSSLEFSGPSSRTSSKDQKDRHIVHSTFLNFKKRKFHLVPSPILECGSSEIQSSTAHEIFLEPVEKREASNSSVIYSGDDTKQTAKLNQILDQTNNESAKTLQDISNTKEKANEEPWKTVFNDMSLKAAIVSVGAPDRIGSSGKVVPISSSSNIAENVSLDNKSADVGIISKEKAQGLSPSGLNVKEEVLQEPAKLTIDPPKIRQTSVNLLNNSRDRQVSITNSNNRQVSVTNSNNRQVSITNSNNIISIRSLNNLEYKTITSLRKLNTAKSRPLTPTSTTGRDNDSLLGYSDLLSDYAVQYDSTRMEDQKENGDAPMLA